jgi:hypothetical protein
MEPGTMSRRNAGSVCLFAFAVILSPGASGVTSQTAAPSADDARALVERAIANQHHNDEASYDYERIERRYVRAGNRITEDNTYRVVPTGTGTLKIPLKEGSQPVDPAVYEKALRDWEQVLTVAMNPNDPREKLSEEKMRKHQTEKAEMVDAVRDAYRFTWLGREAYQGRATIKIGLEPNPSFQPHSRSAEILGHVRATVWIDENVGELLHGEAEIIRDIGVGLGVVAKIYRGGRFQMDQAEVAPGVWLPTRLQYDFEGRKLVFIFNEHETTEMSHYVRRGKPQEALAEVRNELAGKSKIATDP